MPIPAGSRDRLYIYGGRPFPTYADLPALDIDGAIAITKDTDQVWVFDLDTTTWKLASGSGGGSSDKFPKLVTTVQLGVPTSPILADGVYTYTIPLGDTYSQVLLANFQWITAGSFDTAQPGANLGRGSFDSADVGPILSVTPENAKWIRVFRLNYPEFFGATLVAGKVFDGEPETTVALGHGLNEKDVAFDHPELFGTPPKKFAILNAWLNGEDLKITVKNYGEVTLELGIYIGVERVYGYRGDTKWGVAEENFLAICDSRINYDFWVSQDGGESFLNYPNTDLTKIINGVGVYEVDETFFLAVLDYEFNAYRADSPTYSWSQVNTFSLPYGNSPGTYRLNRGDDYQGEPYGGHPLDVEEGIMAFFAFENYTTAGRLFKSVDGLVNIGDNSPAFDNGNPVFKAEDEIADIDLFSQSSSGREYPQSAPIYVKAIDDMTMFVSFAYKAGVTAQNIEITCVPEVIGVAEVSTIQTIANTGGILNNTALYLRPAHDTATYVPWFNSSGAGSQPDLGDYTYIEVPINDEDDAATVAIALDAAIAALSSDFTTMTVDDLITVTNVNIGVTSDLSDESTGFTLNVTTQGVDEHILAGRYIWIYSGQDRDRYILWVKVSGTGDAPSYGPPYTVLEVDIADGDSATDIATAFKAVIDGTGKFTTSQAGAVLTVNALVAGDTADPMDTDTGFGLSVTQQGSTIWRMALCKTVDGGDTWTEVLGSSPDFKDASGRMLGISDDGMTILAMVQGYAQPGSGSLYPYNPQQILFNKSTDGGATFDETDGAWILAIESYGVSIINEGILGGFTAGTKMLAVIAGSDGAPAVIRSEDSGATWSDELKLAPWSQRKAEPNQRGLGSDCIDDFLCFVSYGYVEDDATSYAYRGRLVDSFTNWKAWGLLA